MVIEEQEAMLPVMSAASFVSETKMMPQHIYIGTPPNQSCRGTVFADMHNTAHSDNPGKTWWIEWGIEAVDIKSKIRSIDDAITLAYETNPAMGYRMAEKTIVNEFETMDIFGFARERLGWWTPVAEKRIEYAIPADLWDACKSSELKPEGKTAYGVKFSADGSEVCLCGAVIPKDGPARISLIDRRPTGHGTQWLADWLNARYDQASCVVIDGRNGVEVLCEKIADTWRQKGSVIRPSSHDMISAVSNLTNSLSEHTVTWYEKQPALRESAITSTKRPIGGGWGFGGDNSIPIEAAALALWGARTSKRDPSRKMRIG